MADETLRKRKRDKFWQKLGLDRSASHGAPAQSPPASRSSVVLAGSSISAAPNTVDSNAAVSGSSALNTALPATPGQVSRGPLEPSGEATSSSASADNIHPSALATPNPAYPQGIGQEIIPPIRNKPQTRDLWAEALQKLLPEDQEAIQRLQQNSKTRRPLSETVQELLGLTTEVQDQCKAKSYKFQFRGKQIIMRDVVGKTIFWLNKFKEIGDIAVNFDPIHASLPWAGVRFLLQVC